MGSLNLRFGAIDLIRDGDEYYFIELNPGGQWLFTQLDDELPLLDCFVKYLASADYGFEYDGTVSVRLSQYHEEEGYQGFGQPMRGEDANGRQMGRVFKHPLVCRES